MRKHADLGHRIRNLRKKAGLNQGDVAIAIGRERSSISKLETGLLSLDMRDAVKLAELFGCKVEEIVYDTPSDGQDSIDLAEREKANVDPGILWIIQRARQAVSKAVGFEVTAKQAMQYMAHKADVYELIFDAEDQK